MRIIAGSARGRALKTPQEPSKIRPTSDRTRETIFNVLGQWMDELLVLDLFAGTGALALESLSRGAKHAVLVDSDRQALRLCHDNVEALGFESRVEIMASPVARALERLGKEGRRFDLVFSDPPYASQLGLSVLQQLPALKLLQPEARVVIEHDRREALPEAVGTLAKIDQRKFGDTMISVYSMS